MNKNENIDWVAEGFENIWLPYTQMKNAEIPIEVLSAKGCELILKNGEKLVDGTASWWSVCHGYQHPYIVEKMKEQLEKLSHVMFAGLAHEQAYKLANRLIKFLPSGLERVFFCDSGSTSVEVAMKMSVQYWKNKGNKRKTKFISFRNGYHGDTMGAMSLGDPEGWVAKTYNNYMPHQLVMDIPRDEYGVAEFEALVEGVHKEAAAVIIEPLVQGAGGMKFHAPDVVAEIYRVCKKFDLIFIADEIMTGFWRTGNKFAVEECGVTPDIMCIGKALTGGMVSLAAAVTTKEIYEAFLGEELDRALMHGPTFMANALACAAANASLDLFEAEDFSEKLSKIEKILLEELKELENYEKVKAVRVMGAIGVVELESYCDNMWTVMFDLRKKFLKHGVWLRPFAGMIYIMPSFCISDAELKKLCAAVKVEVIEL